VVFVETWLKMEKHDVTQSIMQTDACQYVTTVHLVVWSRVLKLSHNKA